MACPSLVMIDNLDVQQSVPVVAPGGLLLEQQQPTLLTPIMLTSAHGRNSISPVYDTVISGACSLDALLRLNLSIYY